MWNDITESIESTKDIISIDYKKTSKAVIGFSASNSSKNFGKLKEMEIMQMKVVYQQFTLNMSKVERKMSLKL